MYTDNARVPGTRARSAVPRKPFDGRRQLCTIVEVRFEQVLHSHPFDCGDLVVRPGDALVVMTEKGPQIAKAVTVPERRLMETDRVRRVVRKATPADLRAAADLSVEARRAMKFALTRVRHHGLAMKLVVVEYMLDRSRALVYFTSESRVDFRGLVRELAAELRVRIEMRQIGVRDGTGVIGGIGPCGHELCCSSFLRDFQTVSIREPKEQGITLNPQRITGMCGRLKCCLLYEKQSYTAMRPFTPRSDRSVMTSHGPGSIVEIDALSRKIQVRFPGGAVESLHMRDLIVLDVRLSHEELQATMTREEEVLARRRQKTAGGRVGTQAPAVVAQDDYLWADVEQKVSFFDIEDETPDEIPDDAKRSSSRRRRRRSSSSETAPSAAQPERPSADDGGSPKPRNQKRRARGVGSSDAQGRAPSGEPVERKADNSDARSSRRRRGRSGRPEGERAQAAASKAPKAPQNTAGSPQGAKNDGTSSSSRRRRRRRTGGGGEGTEGGGESGGRE